MKANIYIVSAAIIAALSAMAQADGFMDAETERARNNEANNACEIHGAFGADRQACFSAYLCVNYGDCDGQNMQPIEPLPSGGMYRDNVGGANNG